jgi:hypothetical protein
LDLSFGDWFFAPGGTARSAFFCALTKAGAAVATHSATTLNNTATLFITPPQTI